MYKKRLIAIIVSIFALGVIFGIFTEEYGTFSLRAVFLAAFAFSALYVLFNKRFSENISNKKILAVAVAVAAFSFGALRVSLSANSGVQMAQFDRVYDTAEFEIYEVSSDYVNAYVVSSEKGVPDGERVRLYLDSTEGMLKGDRFVSNVRYSYKSSLSYKASRIYLTASADIDSFQNGKGVFYQIRKSVHDTSEDLYSDFEFAPKIAKAIIVGDRSSLDTYDYSLFKASGLSHLLAISGLHISLIAFGVHSLLSLFISNRKIKSMVSVVVAVAYGALVGFTPSVLRAVVMFSVVMLLEMLLRRADSITSLFLSLMLLLIINPYSICSVGMQLSYLCSLGILLIQPILVELKMYCSFAAEESENIVRRLFKIIPVMVTPLLIAFASSVFSFPVLCMSFDTVTYIAPLTNILLVPLFSYATVFSVVGYFIAPVYMPLAKIIAYPAGLIFDVTAKISRFIYDAELGNTSTHTVIIVIPLVLSIVMILALACFDRYKVSVFVTSAILFIVSLYACPILNHLLIDKSTVIEYNDSNAFEYIYYQSASANVYVDSGGYYAVNDPIYDNGCTSLDAYFVFDYDNYSLKRFENVSGGVKVRTVYLFQPKNNSENDVYLQIKELAKRRNCDIIDCDYSNSINLDKDFTLSVYRDSYDYSAVLICLTYGEKTYKFVKGNYSYPVYADTVVFMDGFSGEVIDIYADEIFASDMYLQNNKTGYFIKSFDEKLIINVEDYES